MGQESCSSTKEADDLVLRSDNGGFDYVLAFPHIVEAESHLGEIGGPATQANAIGIFPTQTAYWYNGNPNKLLRITKNYSPWAMGLKPGRTLRVRFPSRGVISTAPHETSAPS